MKEQEELKDAVAKLVNVIDENPCGMGRAMFWALALFIKEMCKFFKRKRYLSTEEACTILGISPRISFVSSGIFCTFVLRPPRNDNILRKSLLLRYFCRF